MMKKLFGNLQTLTIVFLILIIILLRMCQGKPNPNKTPDPEIITITKIEYDTIREKVTEYVPKWRDRKLPPDTVYKDKDVDTAAILKDYFAEYTYNDTIDHDTVKIFINDVLTENKIASRSIEYEILYPTKTITTIEKHYINNREFYIGPHLGGTVTGQSGLNFVGVEGVFKSKKNKTLSLSAGVNKDFGVQVGVGLHWKLGRKN